MGFLYEGPHFFYHGEAGEHFVVALQTFKSNCHVVSIDKGMHGDVTVVNAQYRFSISFKDEVLILKDYLNVIHNNVLYID